MTDEKNLSTFEEGSEDFAAMFAAQEAGTVQIGRASCRERV